MTPTITVTFVVGLTLCMTPKGYGVIRGRRDLFYDHQGQGDLYGRFDLVYAPKRSGVIRGRRDLLHDHKSHGDLFGPFDLLYDPKRSQGH